MAKTTLANTKAKAKSKATAKAKAKKTIARVKAKEQSPTNKTNRAARAKGSHFARDCWSRTHQDKTVNEVEGAKVNADAAKEFVFTIENTVQDVSLSQSGCESHDDGLVMIDSETRMDEHSKITVKDESG